jgi:hypothetical protein
VSVNPSPLLSDPDVLTVRASFCDALARFPLPLANAGRHVLDRITTSNWTPEWYLPRWLGDAFGLQPDVCRTLVLCNIYGSAYVRLQDDLADGDVDQASRLLTTCLANALYQQAILQYVRLFERESAFWGYLEQFMAQWLGATLSSNSPDATDFRSYREEDFLRLAERGSGLKVCCAAACLLAGREEVIPILTSALDHFLVAAVLADHACDWADDLAAGRYNAFVAYASPLPQVADQREANRRNVLEEIYLGDAARPYFDVVRRQVRTAFEIARGVGCSGLSEYLLSLEKEVVIYHERLAEEARGRLRAAKEQLFGLPMTSAPLAISEEGR